MATCRTRRCAIAIAAAAAGAVWTAAIASAAPATNNLRAVADVTARIDGTYYDDHQGVSRGRYATGLLMDFSSFAWSRRVGVDALVVVSNRIVFSPDVDFMDGTNIFADEDLVAYDAAAGTITMYFDGSVAGIPERVNLTSASLPAAGVSGFLFTIDITASLPGVGTVTDEDILRYSGAAFSKLYDGATTIGIPDNAAVDSLYLAGDSRLYFSLNKPATIGAATGTERDLWAFTPPAGPVSLAVTSSISLPPGMELAALDEPVDTDGDLLTDYEELSGADEESTVVPGTTFPLDPNGHRTNPHLGDTDGDHVSDGDEGAAGSNPTNALDYLHITRLERVGSTNLVTWASASNRQYRVYVIDDGALASGQWLWVAVDYPSQGRQTVLTNASLEDLEFYRVQLSFP